MSSVYAPEAILDLFHAIRQAIPSAGLSGVVPGPNEGHFGYHWAYASPEIPGNDDSRLGVLNKPPTDKWASSALDVGLPRSAMKACTARLVAAARANDKRLVAVREFCGTLDGKHTHNYEMPERRLGTDEWDSTHLSHIHLSFYRRYSLNAQVLLPIARVFAGDHVVIGHTGMGTGSPVGTEAPVGTGWPLHVGDYFGLRSGPAQSHGGFFEWERPFVKRIQQKMQALGYAPKTAGWADGIYEKPTAVAVAAWQHAKYAKLTTRFGEVWSDDWKRLFG